MVYLIDGADPDSTPVSDYVKLAAETSFVKRFVIAVTKSDRLPAEAVQQAMLAEYDTVSAQFTFPELQLMREYAMQDLLRAVCPAAARLESELLLLGRNSQIRTVFTSALGTNTEAGRLLGPYRPYVMTDLALTLIHDD